MMTHVLLFLISVWILHGEPIDEDYLEEGKLLPPGVIIQPEYGVANWDQTLANIEQNALLRQGAQAAELERETGAHMRDLHEPDNPDAQNRALFFLHPDSQSGGKGTKVRIASDDLANFKSGPRPLDIPAQLPPKPVETQPVETPPPVVHQVVPEPVPEPEPEPVPPAVPSRYQPVIIHHEDPSNPARRVSIHNLADSLIPYQHRPDRPELAPQDPEPEPINVQAESSALPPGCKEDGAMQRNAEEHTLVTVNEYGHEIVQPKLLPIPKPQDCNRPSPPTNQVRPQIQRNEPLLVKPCGMAMPGEPCYTTPIPTMFPTTTTTTTRRPTFPPTTTKKPSFPPTTTATPTKFPTTTKKPTLNPTTTKKPTLNPTTTKKPTNVPTTTTKTIIIQPVIIVPDVTSTSPPDLPGGCQGVQCKDKFINGIEAEAPAPPEPQPVPPKSQLHELHVHHFHVHQDGTVQSAYTKSLIMAGRNPDNDPLEEEGKEMEGLELPPCSLDNPNHINCDMSSALTEAAQKKGMSPSALNAAKDPSADNINAMLNDNPPDDDVALAALQTKLDTESKKENEHLRELEEAEGKLEVTNTKSKAEEAGLALEKREMKREITESEEKLANSHEVEAKLAAKKQEAETQLALDDKQTQRAIQEAYVKAAQDSMLEQQKKQEYLQIERIRSQESAVNSNSDSRVSTISEQHPERITYLYLAGSLLIFSMVLYCVRRKSSDPGYVLLDANIEEV